jgi:oxalate decarboxylase/phosphoglucose isomerase-like protein (cupin superfamily)
MAQTRTDFTESIREAEAFRSPYELWKESQGLPTLRGYFVKNLYDVELTPWKERGGSGVFINLEGTGGFNDTYVYELPSKESSIPIRHIYEETIFILKGQGATTVWIDENKKQTFEWRERSYFAIPPNAWCQHHNLSGGDPARYVAMTAAPRIIDTFKDLDFVFQNPWVFRDRFNGEDSYFKESEKPGRGTWSTNFLADVIASTPQPGKVGTEGRGGGTVATVFAMVNSTVRSHSQAWPVGAHSKFHRHGPGIHVVLLRGRGYSLMFKEGQPMERIDWGPGSMFVPPEEWWHAHYNTGPDPALFLAIGWGSDKPKAGGRQYVYKSVKDGGDQYEFEDEDPKIHADYEADLARNGVKCMMGPVHPYCNQK